MIAAIYEGSSVRPDPVERKRPHALPSSRPTGRSMKSAMITPAKTTAPVGDLFGAGVDWFNVCPRVYGSVDQLR